MEELSEPITHFKKTKRNLLFFGSCLLVFALLAIDSNNYNKIVEQSELVQIKGTLQEKPYITKGKSSSVAMHLNEFPEFSFLVSGWRYGAFRANSFVSNCKSGDSITLEILNRDYQTKIIKSATLRISERIMNYHSIEPYSILHNNINYLALTDVNNCFKDNNDLGNWFSYGFIFLFLFVTTIYFILKVTGATKKIKKWFPMN